MDTEYAEQPSIVAVPITRHAMQSSAMDLRAGPRVRVFLRGFPVAVPGARDEGRRQNPGSRGQRAGERTLGKRP